MVVVVLLVALTSALIQEYSTATLGIAALVLVLWVLHGVDPARLRGLKAAA
jgi:hypothetical protein